MTRRRRFHRHAAVAFGLSGVRAELPQELRAQLAATSTATTRVTLPCSHAPRPAKRLSSTSVYPPRQAITPPLYPRPFPARHSGYTALR